MDSDPGDEVNWDSSGPFDLAEKIGNWLDHPSWDPAGSESDDELCRQFLSAERTSRFGNSDSLVEIEEESFAAKTSPSVGGQFRIEEKIGEGSFGIVFRAFDYHLKRYVAVKVLRPSLGREPKLFRRFVREAQAVATLRAQGVVQIFDVGRAGGQPYFVMELIEVPSLQQ